MSRKSLKHGEALCSGDNVVTSDAHEIGRDNDNDGDDDDDGLDVSRADDGLDVMTGNHVLPELRALSWSINCYNCYTQQSGHRHACSWFQAK